MKPLVAYWLAGHLSKTSPSTDEAAAYAEEAHKALDRPATAMRLGRIRMYQHRFDEAEELLTSAADHGVGKTSVIAETDLLDLAHRRVESCAFEARQPAKALEVLGESVSRARDFREKGLNDRRYNIALVELLAEGLLVAVRADDVGSLEPHVSILLEAIDRHFAIASVPARRTLWERRLEWLAARDDLNPDLRSYSQKILSRLSRQTEKSGEGLVSGEVLNYSGQKRFGFIKLADGDSVFFHRDHVADAQDCVFLYRGAEVTCRVLEIMRDGEPSTRADAVRVALEPAQHDAAFRRRRGRVINKSETFLFAEEAATQERIFVHRSAFPMAEDWRRAKVGTPISFDIELHPRGPKALAGSASVETASQTA